MGTKLNLHSLIDGGKFILHRTNCFNNLYIWRYLHKAKMNVNPEKIHIKREYDTKLLKVAIIGLPNAGKSTLVNNLMDRKVCPASSKVHTTRKKSNSIITEGKTQIVFLDTPGIISNVEQKKFNLENAFFKDCEKSMNLCDIIGVVHDVGNHWTRHRLDIKIIRLLERFNQKSSFLILNKIDELKSKRKLLDVTKTLTNNCLNSISFGKPDDILPKDVRGWPNFTEVFMISALKNDGVEDLKNYLLNQAKPNQWMYSATQWTDQTPEDIIVKTVQATLLDFLPQEIPYTLKTEIEFLEVLDNGTISAVVLVGCPLERIRKLVVGIGDGKLRQITEKIQKDLQVTFYTHVSLKIVVSSSIIKK